jgi:hypothetical protein
MRFRTYLALLVASLTIPPFAVGGGLLIHQAQERRHVELRSLVNQAQALAAAVDREIAGTLKAAEAIAFAVTPEELWDPERLRPRFRALLARNPAWLNVVLIRPDATQALNTLLPPGATLPEGPATLVSQKPGAMVPTVSDPFSGRVAKVPLVTVRATIPGSGEPGWAVGIGIGAHQFQSTIDAVLPPGSLAAVVGRNGRFVAHTSTPQGDRTAAPAPPEVARIAAAASPGSTTMVETRRVTGQPVDAALHRMSVAS